MTRLRRQRHPVMLVLLLGVDVVWLIVALWAAWDSADLQRTLLAQSRSVLGVPISGAMLIMWVLFASSWAFVMTCSGFGSRRKQSAAGSSPRPRWAHDLPLTLYILAWIDLGGEALGSPPFARPLGVPSQFVLFSFSALMFLTLSICACILARYGLPGDPPRWPDAARPTP